MYLILFVNRVNIATAAPLMKADLGLSNTQLGLAFSAFAIPYALFQLIGGWIGDKLGPRLTLSACCAMVGLSTMLTGAAGGFASLFALRLALGFGEGAAFPTATRAMSSWTPAGSWGFAQGITHSFARIGNAVTPPLMAALLAVRVLARLLRDPGSRRACSGLSSGSGIFATTRASIPPSPKRTWRHCRRPAAATAERFRGCGSRGASCR